MDTATIIIALITGMTIGSFLNVVICRTISGESIVFPASHCTKCGHKLAALDLIPVLSYILLRGRCRYCGDKISIQYPLVEILTGVTFAAVVFKYGISVKMFIYLIAVSTIITAAVIDLKTKEVHYRNIIIPMIIILVLVLLTESKQEIAGRLLSAVVGFAPLFLFYMMGEMGDGDFVVGAFVGFCLGKANIVIKAMFIAFIIGGIYGLWLICKKLQNRKEQVPFVPFLAVGTILSMLL